MDAYHAGLYVACHGKNEDAPNQQSTSHIYADEGGTIGNFSVWGQCCKASFPFGKHLQQAVRKLMQMPMPTPPPPAMPDITNVETINKLNFITIEGC